MKHITIKIVLLSLFFPAIIFGQFGKNKVQYKDFDWYYIQTDHFDIYFSQKGETLAEFTSKAAENALTSIQKSFNYKINNRITLIIYNSQNDFQETNVIDQYLSEGIEGFTELFKNRVVIQYMGSYKKFRHLIHHELVHAVMNDMFYGGSIQNIISNNISINIPTWFSEGMAEYQALGWDVDTDMFIRDAAINEYLPDIQSLGGYFAYRGGQSVFYYIDRKYGKEKIGELIGKIRNTGNVETGVKEAIGLDIEELNERWKKEIKRIYWPDIAKRKDPDEFAKRLTNHKKDGGSYNTSPAISPQGDKVAFLSNRDFYFDLYIMSAIDGKIIKKLIKGNRTADFEELNILTPSLTWSPDGKKIALGAKSGGYDVVYIIDVESEDRETIPLWLEGVKSVTWSPDGKSLAFIGHTATQSDVYLYNLENQQLDNLTDDLFSDSDPAWSFDGSKIFFSSDRIDKLSKEILPDSFKIYKHNYNQQDIYSFELNTKKIERITSLPFSDEVSPIASPDGNHLLFISDINGINNIYRKSLTENNSIDKTEENSNDLIPVTNSLNGLYQLSTSKDGKKLSFTSLYQSAFNIFLMNNPFESILEEKKLEPTLYISSLLKKENGEEFIERDSSAALKNSFNDSLDIYVGNIVDTSKVYGDSVEIDFSNYVFGTDFNLPKDTSNNDDSKFNLANNLDKQGNYKVNKYKITFSPDIVYANAGYSSLYGLQGTTVISFSDVLGNHRLIGVTSLQIDLKNSDYGLAYYYLPERIDYGIEAFHTARFVFLSRGITSDLVRFRNFGAVGSLSYPLNRFKRIEAGLSWLNISQENLDNPNEETDKVSYIIPSLGFVHDNVLWGYTSPIDGSRYRFDIYGNPGLSDRRLSFYSILGDYRRYLRFWTDYSFVFRYSGGYSAGNNPQRFFIGGIENWINRSFATTDIPLESASDFAFLTAALPLRGFDYAERIGTRYSLVNMEFRFPLIRYLVTGALPILFRNILGVAFVDVGTAWTKDKDLKLFERNNNGNVVTKDLLMGTGIGARVFFLYFLVRFDVAWAYNVDGFTKPKFYLSLGADF
ncbi:MAG: biopolymer transporter Tol [Ignavibacteria bacterium RIFOXYB2_FULL_35_12]|nr:MAG: biopolymer transporter Tol [Ignavibacteria bacterium GWA2_36_19]OGU49903.1 MAG: biopolymer transporter Tol [Ignavibacteria bacterium GWC2_35_8]OGU57435.1 MAG: biopolymer transporter Tol [Ignavibacteria bacterium GWF2_35_20]OGU83574.1 MAG: biopolymer transporter Tol [Ignavibacteria bacterium RIFOXYA2_FULL_35_9]OGU88372.1 MAG: biopolymer transporter Tol [Ignavibacteria bacterium RIFOXYC12_FULL_35_11]OGU91557.1 MAG: biopolymer transporter Tol [Ignavibacteria bacterium RIFOXYA12_FULL_35_25